MVVSKLTMFKQSYDLRNVKNYGNKESCLLSVLEIQEIITSYTLHSPQFYIGYLMHLFQRDLFLTLVSLSI